MVESEGREGIESEPFGTSSIVASSDSKRVVHHGKKSNGDGAATGVAVDLGIGTQLRHGIERQARFLLQLAACTLFGRLLHLHKTTG